VVYRLYTLLAPTIWLCPPM